VLKAFSTLSVEVEISNLNLSGGHRFAMPVFWEIPEAASRVLRDISG